VLTQRGPLVRFSGGRFLTARHFVMAITSANTSHTASPEPVTHAGWGPWEVVLGGHSSSPANTGYANPSSFQIVSAGPSPPESDYSGAHALYQDVIIV